MFWLHNEERLGRWAPLINGTWTIHEIDSASSLLTCARESAPSHAEELIGTLPCLRVLMAFIRSVKIGEARCFQHHTT